LRITEIPVIHLQMTSIRREGVREAKPECGCDNPPLESMAGSRPESSLCDECLGFQVDETSNPLRG